MVVALVCFTCLKKAANRKLLCQWIELLTNTKFGIKETGTEVGDIAGFCYHHLATMSTHMHAYHCPLFDGRMKTGMQIVALCRKDRVLLSTYKKQQ